MMPVGYRKRSAKSLTLLLATMAAGCQSESARDTAADTLVVTPPTPPADTLAVTPGPQPPANSNACADPPTPADRTICVPNRVGPVRPSMARADLVRLFGDNAVRDRQVDVGEGQMEPGSALLPGSADSALIVWADSSRTRIVGMRGFGSRWSTPDGIRVGSTLEQLEAAIGPFELTGFGWDYGGTVMLENTRMARAQGLVFFRLEPRDPSTRSTPAYGRVRGERAYPSTSPDVRALDLVIARIDIRWGT